MTIGTIISLVFISATSAAVPQLINFQGKLTDNSDVVLTGTYNVTFRVYDASSGWTEDTKVRGRVIVGLGAPGTLEATVGSNLTSQGTRTITEVPAHTHTIDPPSTSTSSNTITVSFSGGGSTGGIDAQGSSGVTVKTLAHSSHSHTVDIGSFTSGSTGSASVDVTMPYIQYLACVKD